MWRVSSAVRTERQRSVIVAESRLLSALAIAGHEKVVSVLENDRYRIPLCRRRRRNSNSSLSSSAGLGILPQQPQRPRPPQRLWYAQFYSSSVAAWQPTTTATAAAAATASTLAVTAAASTAIRPVPNWGAHKSHNNPAVRSEEEEEAIKFLLASLLNAQGRFPVSSPTSNRPPHRESTWRRAATSPAVYVDEGEIAVAVRPVSSVGVVENDEEEDDDDASEGFESCSLSPPPREASALPEAWEQRESPMDTTRIAKGEEDGFIAAPSMAPQRQRGPKPLRPEEKWRHQLGAVMQNPMETERALRMAHALLDSSYQHGRPPMFSRSFLDDLFHRAIRGQNAFGAEQILRCLQKFEFVARQAHGNHQRDGPHKSTDSVYAGTPAAPLDLFAGYYKHICFAVSFLDPEKSTFLDMKNLIIHLMQEIRTMSRPYQQDILPLLCSSLVKQRSLHLGQYATSIYRYMQEQELEFTPGFLEHLLWIARYNRQDDVPYDDVLYRLAFESDRLPFAVVVAQVIETAFPFSNMDKTHRMLQAFVRLLERDQELPLEQRNHYRLDSVTLEAIASAVAQARAWETALVVWDIVATAGMQPTEGIYESTAIAFASTPDQFESMWAVLTQMEEEGMVPSRALIRGLSWRIRETTESMVAALTSVTENLERAKADTSGKTRVSLVAINTVASACAERGEHMFILDLLHRLQEGHQENDENIPLPDADTFGFALEALGKSLAREMRRSSSTGNSAVYHLTSDHLETSNRILDDMEQVGMVPTSDVLRAYMELLCLSGDVDTATAVVLESNPMQIDNKTIYRVAAKNLELRNFVKARQVADLSSSGDLAFLSAKIDRVEEETKRAI